MENIETESTGIEGAIVPSAESASTGADDIGNVVEQREDSIGGVGSEEIAPEEVIYKVVPEAAVASFPVILVNPGGTIFRPYGEAAQDFQSQIIGLKDPHVNWLTIGQMTVPSLDAPAIYKTPYCGFPVIQGDKFSVLLSDGQMITA